MNLINGVIHFSDEDMRDFQELKRVGLSIVDILETTLLKKNKFDLSTIEAIKFNNSYFHLSSQLILALPRLRMKYNEKASLIN
jgi:hypothetical protein